MQVGGDTDPRVEESRRRNPVTVITHTQYDPLLPSSDVPESADPVRKMVQLGYRWDCHETAR